MEAPITQEDIQEELKVEHGIAVGYGRENTAKLLSEYLGLDSMPIVQMAILTLMDALRKDGVL